MAQRKVSIELEANTSKATSELEDLRKEIECPICYEVINNNELQLSNCGHKFCKTCYDRILRDSNECAVCKKKLKWN